MRKILCRNKLRYISGACEGASSRVPSKPLPPAPQKVERSGAFKPHARSHGDKIQHATRFSTSSGCYGASSLCWPRLRFDLPNPILRFRPPNIRQNRSAPQTPSKNAIKYICKKGTFFGGIRMCCTLAVYPKGYSQGVLEKHWATCPDHPSTVVNEVPKRAFQPAIDLGLQAAEMRQARKNGEVCALRY